MMKINSIKKGEFTYNQHVSLRDASRDIPDEQGIYLIYDHLSELIYFGKAGGITKKGKVIGQKLRGRLNNRVSKSKLGIKDWSRENFFNHMMKEEAIDQLRIEWYVTREDPRDIEDILYEFYQEHLPRWNEKLGRKKRK